MGRKRALERSPPASFSSNEQWFIGKLGRDVWKHKVLEFLLPARRTQFKKAWFELVVREQLWSKAVHCSIRHTRLLCETNQDGYIHISWGASLRFVYQWRANGGQNMYRFSKFTNCYAWSLYIDRLFPF